MKIGIIGYRRHAEKHVKIAQSLYGKENLTIYHPDKKSELITNDFVNLLVCNCIVISSPTNTHLFYIKKLAKSNYRGHIYLEKPGFSTIKESFELEELQLKNNLKITIGYHYPYEKKIIKILDILKDKETGELISIDIVISQGIAYSNWFKKDWRNQDKHAIAHTVLSHALSIYYFFTNSYNYSEINTKVFYNNETKSFDTAIASSIKSKPLFKAITSWGCPFVDDKIDIITTNSLISLEGDLIIVKSPRNTFDSNGFYTNPKTCLSQKLVTEGIEPAMISFYQSCEKSDFYDNCQFKKSLSIGRLCVSAKIIY